MPVPIKPEPTTITPVPTIPIPTVSVPTMPVPIKPEPTTITPVPTIPIPTVSMPTILIPTVSMPTMPVPTMMMPTMPIPTMMVPTITPVPTILVPTIPVPTMPIPTIPVPTIIPVSVPTTSTLNRRSCSYTNHYNSINNFRDIHLRQRDTGYMVYNELYHEYFSSQLADNSPIIESLKDSVFFDLLNVIFGKPKNGVWYGWYIAYDFNYQTHWDCASILKSPRYSTILNSSIQFRGKRESFENYIKMIYNRQINLLEKDQEFIETVARRFFSYRSDLLKCYSEFTNNRRYNILRIENIRITKSANNLYRRLLLKPVSIDTTPIDLTQDVPSSRPKVLTQVPIPATVQVPIPAVVQVPIPVAVQVPIPDAVQVPIPDVVQVPIPVAVQVPIPDVVQVPIPVAVQVPIPVTVQVPIPVVVQVPIPVTVQVPIEIPYITPLPLNTSLPLSSWSFDSVNRKRSMFELLCESVYKTLRENNEIDQNDELSYKRIKLEDNNNNNE